MEANSERQGYRIDRLMVIALSLLAYTLSVMLHEHLGHGAACLLLGGRPVEWGAFYLDCNYGNMPDLSIRLVALAGPLISFLTGLIGFFVLSQIARASSASRYLIWLFSTISLMTATGYLLFSGVSGLGDFGTSRDGALYALNPEWLWRVVLTVVGIAGYLLVVFVSLRRIEPIVGGGGEERVRVAQNISLTSYLSGAILFILVGLLNPHGMIIVLTSAAASSLGGTSGLAWMMQFLNRKKVCADPPMQLDRNWPWFGVSMVVTVLYAVILGPTIRP